MRSGFEILVWVIFPQIYLWIHDKYSSIRFKQSEWQKKILQHYLVWWVIGAVVAWPSLQRPHFFAGGSWGATGFQPPACLLLFFFFLSSFFYPFAFYCLFSLLTPLASRDFCENVFLVLCTKIGSFHHIDASFFIVCPLIDHNIASWHCQSVVDPRARAPGEWIY